MTLPDKLNVIKFMNSSLKIIFGFLFFFIAGQLVSAETSDNFNSYQGLKVRIMSATWCPACKELHASLEKELEQGFFYLQDRQKINLKVPLKAFDEYTREYQDKQTKYVPELQIIVNKKIVYAHPPDGFDADSFKSFMLDTISELIYQNQIYLNNNFLDYIPKPKYVSVPQNQKSLVTLIGTGKSDKNLPLQSLDDLNNAKQKISEQFPAVPVISLFNHSQYEDNIVYTWNDDRGEAMHSLSAQNFFTLDTMKQITDLADKTGSKNRLWIFAGHGAQDGFLPTHNAIDKDDYLTPLQFSVMLRNSQDTSSNVMISGNCFGGNYANVAGCGFFEARPDSYAMACMKEKRPSDYLSLFITEGIKLNSAADFDHNGTVSFEEAHWYATINGTKNLGDMPYTSIDDLAEFMFSKWEDDADKRFKSFMSRAEIIDLLVKFGDAGEKAQARDLLNDFVSDPSTWISVATAERQNTINMKDKNQEFGLSKSISWQQFDDWRTVRWVQLARRLLIKKYAKESPDESFAIILRYLQNCENQSIRRFLSE